jgi:hypothetical protein
LDAGRPWRRGCTSRESDGSAGGQLRGLLRGRRQRHAVRLGWGVRERECMCVCKREVCVCRAKNGGASRVDEGVGTCSSGAGSWAKQTQPVGGPVLCNLPRPECPALLHLTNVTATAAGGNERRPPTRAHRQGSSVRFGSVLLSSALLHRGAGRCFWTTLTLLLSPSLAVSFLPRPRFVSAVQRRQAQKRDSGTSTGHEKIRFITRPRRPWRQCRRLARDPD